MTISSKELSSMSDERLRRKAFQTWDMAGLARQDGDTADEKCQTEEARQYDAEILRRRTEKQQ